MITNAVCTVVRAEESRIVYCGPCMWQEVKGSEVKKYGEERADSVNIYISDVNADIKDGDMIVKGEYVPPETVIRDGLTVSNTARHDYGSEDMQHIRVGAK